MLVAVGLTVTALVLAPLAAPGYVLSYDMVFVPHQPWRAELVVPGDSLPRAVPLDALVSLAGQLAPGWLVQRVVLAAVLLLAVVGAGRLVPTRRPVTRAVAALGYAWTPYLAERLLIGHWGLLLAYGALPWLVGAAIGVRAGRPGSLRRLVPAALPAAVTPTGGLIALATVAVLVARRDAPRRTVGAVGAVLLLNLPWLVAAALTRADGRSDPAGVTAFAARAENWSGWFGALAGTGGIWNAQTTPTSRSSPLAPVATVLLLGAAVLGLGALRRRWPGGAAVRLAALAAGGFLAASLGVLPGTAAALRWAVATVPGAGLLRDGQKFLVPYALLLALAVALGVERLADRVAERGAVVGGRVLVASALLLPLVVLPDLAYGVGGRLRPVRYPADWAEVARRLDGRPGEVLSLPFGAYRAYPWNDGRTVLDPLPRYVDADVVVDDTLWVGDLRVAGENPRAAEVARVLTSGSPVAATGVRWVVVQRMVGDRRIDPAAMAGLREVYAGTDLTLYENSVAGAR
ncbi:hypothetical protein [Micromonospora mirobrigensis]|uniref:4-amino-4-deoxy-L-arabinose transferase n=1 Tax=Micromonospora mirobrigensis TaxID=262898 RepID=A0A1C4ZL32_9ACTN|nr:hypothetical protein [Micromonospora mirobrigensis]SCF33599.1 hypothetical protein GA0070564_1068 [Micromonospora mirobrigensis]